MAGVAGQGLDGDGLGIVSQDVVFGTLHVMAGRRLYGLSQGFGVIVRVLGQQRGHQQLFDLLPYKGVARRLVGKGRRGEELHQGLPGRALRAAKVHAQLELDGTGQGVPQLGAAGRLERRAFKADDELVALALPAHVQRQRRGKHRGGVRPRSDLLVAAADLGAAPHGHLHQQEVAEAVGLYADVGPVAKPVDRGLAQGKMVHEGIELLAPAKHIEIVGLEDPADGAAGFVEVMRMKEAQRKGIAGRDGG